MARQSGYKTEEEIDNAVEHMRSAMSLFGRDQEILNAANYLKYNRMQPFPSWLMHQKFRDVPLHEGALSGFLKKGSDIKYHLLVSVSVT